MELSDFHPGGAAVERIGSDALLCAAGALIVELVKNLSSPVLLLDWDLRVVCQSRAVDFRGILLLNARDGSPCLADRVRELCFALKAQWLQSRGWDRTAAEPQSGASIVLLLEDSNQGARPFFLVQCAAPSEGLGAGLLARLTACERQVAILVGEGCTNDEVAAKLAKSALTVKKQLRSIFQKLHVTSRARLCALMHQSRFVPVVSADTPKD